MYKYYSTILTINRILAKHFWGFWSSKKCRNLAIFGQIWLTFGFKKVIFWLYHSVSFRLSSVKRT